MKLRYYLRGLGTGVLVAALILGRLINASRPLTDAEIKAMALTLGMVDANSLSLSDVSGSGGTLQSSSDEGSEAGVPGSSESFEPDANETPDPDDSVAPEATDDLDSTVNSGSSSVSAVTPGTTMPEPDSEESVTIEIFRGDGSYTVSLRLEEVGLVADAREFDAYLVDSGHSRSIRAGTYKIPVGASWDEIIDIIS